MASTPDADVAQLRLLAGFIDIEWKLLGGLWLLPELCAKATDERWQRRNGVDLSVRLTWDELKELGRERAAEMFRARGLIGQGDKGRVFCIACGKKFRSNAERCLIHILDEHDGFPAVKAAGKE
jgi:hypothetical protein